MHKNLIRSLLRIVGLVAVALSSLWLLIARPILPRGTETASETMTDKDRLKEHVAVVSGQMSPRSHLQPANLDRVADYISSEFASTGARTHEQRYTAGGRAYKNVIAEYGPESNEVIVVGAHYDAEGPNPGADDNASGIAGLLELGRLLSGAELRSRVLLAAYTLEEPPYFGTDEMGSAVHAKSLKEKGVDVKLMISLEMIGYFSDEKGSQSFPMPLLRLFYPSRGNFIAIVDRVFSGHGRRMKKVMARAIEMPVCSINAPSRVPGVDFSDHRNFWKYDYPAVMVTDTAFYRNRSYHTPEDTADKLDYDRMAQVVFGVCTYIKHLSGAGK